jgi:beta-glucanase (GH16 family)
MLRGVRRGFRDQGLRSVVGRLAAAVTPLLAALVIVPAASGIAPRHATIAASFNLSGARLTVRGTVHGEPFRGSDRMLLEQRLADGGSGRWVMRRRVALGRRGTFALRWTAPAKTTTFAVRLALVSGRRTYVRTGVHRLTVARRGGASTPSPPASTSSCGGELPPAKPGDGSWTCAFDDEFDASTGDASALDTSWWVPQVTATSGYTTGPLGSEACYENSPNNISVSGGALHLTVRQEPAPVECGGLPTQYTAGMVSTYGTFNQTYGRFEVRAELPATTASGLQETLWLWPVNDTLYGSWPGSGEVDFSEFYSQYSNLDIPYIHYNYDASTVNTATNTNTVTAYNCQITPGQYNDYAVVWTPGSFTITINGSTCLIDNYVPDGGLTAPEPFDQPFFIALTQALGIDTNSFNPATTPLPATTSIDYVRVWK